MWPLDDIKKAKQVESQIVEASRRYKEVFSGEDGEWVLNDLRKRCFIDHTTYSDSHGQMGFNEGRRSVFMHIQNLISKDLRTILDDLTKE